MKTRRVIDNKIALALKEIERKSFIQKIGNSRKEKLGLA